MPHPPPTGPVSIYVLRDPASGDVRYVGQTKNPDSRYHGHCSLASLANVSSPAAVWCNRLVAAGNPPIFEVIDEVPPEKADEAELEAIRRHSKPRPLLNIKGIIHFSHVPMRRVVARWLSPPQPMRNGAHGRVHFYAELLQCGHYRYGASREPYRRTWSGRRLDLRRRCNQCVGIPIE